MRVTGAHDGGITTTPERFDPAGLGDTRFELHCTACGYGVVVRIAPVTCPMCRGSVWEYAAPVRRGRR